jgi:uncharacterized tellurite resistance protein B-like protein
VSSAKTAPHDQAFALELVKLLLQVAWADHEVAPTEEAALLEIARRFGLSEAEQGRVRSMLRREVPLSPPDLGLLRGRRTEVLRAVKQLLLTDSHVAEEEEEVLAELASLLS